MTAARSAATPTPQGAVTFVATEPMGNTDYSTTQIVVTDPSGNTATAVVAFDVTCLNGNARVR